MLNNTVLVGRLTKDVELKKTTNGTSVVSFTLAVNRRFKQGGQPDADFISCQAWSATADNMARYLHKGSLIGVEGRIQTRSYDDKDGKRVYITEVVANNVTFLESRNSNETPQTQENHQSYEDTYGLNFESSDLPF